MAKLTDEAVGAAFAPHLQDGEELTHWAFGVKQPNMLLIAVLIALAILPGIIAIALLTKNYVIGLTDRRFIVLQVKSMGNTEVKAVIEYTLDEIRAADVKTSTGAIFTHIKVSSEQKPFVAKFHRAFSKTNRPNAVAICEAINPAAAG